MTSFLELQAVGKKFPGFHLENISFALPPGYIMGLVGPNGAGKTTTIKLILGMLKLDAGSIRIFGQELKADEASFKENIGVVFDKLMFVDGWTVNDTERAISGFYRNWDKEHFDGLLDQFELPRKKRLIHFSRGMQMKLMLAVALAHDAKLLILDEPTSGLDALTRDQLSTILQNYIKDGERSVLFSTHISTDLERIADFITVINEGKLFYSGTLDGLMDRFYLIKGKTTDLTRDLEEKILGLRSTDLGFEGLIKVEDATKLDRIYREQPTLDDIVICASKRRA